MGRKIFVVRHGERCDYHFRKRGTCCDFKLFLDFIWLQNGFKDRQLSHLSHCSPDAENFYSF